MDEILNKINELDEYLSEERLARMTPQERTNYLELVEKLKARVDTLIELIEGGDE